jgi:hypothetical protein
MNDQLVWFVAFVVSLMAVAVIAALEIGDDE